MTDIAELSIYDLSLGNRILRVNHAGEHGAVHIYRGQLLFSPMTAPALVSELSEFKRHEERHRGIFAAELARRGLLHCRGYGLCALGGYGLGIITGALGKQAIAATTVAVETVVLKHLNQQLAMLSHDPAAQQAIAAILAEESEHHDSAARHVDMKRLCPRIIGFIVGISTEAVIWMGMNF